MVNKDKLSVRSKFFKAAIAKKWKEGEEEVVRLPEVEPDIFQMYADWAYSNVVTPAYPLRAETRSLVKLFLLGDFLDDIRLRIKTMELLVASVKTVNTFPSVDSIALIWNNTTAESLLRTWMLDIVAKYSDQAAFARWTDKLPAGFVLQVALKFLPEQRCDIDPSFMTNASKYLEVEEVD
jgi:hypothetical protein